MRIVHAKLLIFLLMTLCSVPAVSYAVTFTTDVTDLSDFTITGSITKGSGTFVIDHPQKPRTHLLYHSFVESPDVKNLYDGVVVLGAGGEAVVHLPNYFEALNKDFRYQLKPIGSAMPNLHIKEEIANNQFTIAGGVPGGRVSWQVTGVRHDPYILANPIIPEVEKGPDALVDRGEFLFPEAYGLRGAASIHIRDLFKPFLGGFRNVFQKIF
ncbi:hypothetical protein COU18_02445 [Candidatus Kaiserbacteria bacterium CG10_big_fil_rev_8_21_14_0_10_51_14]|uniref:Uncharacterized protein n=1 Tax=Candidatus Kaiserbacteria bacterium CG10_big_fil_rev_8_21_14_0_10_51_14 TaxID=1974610 RepID=A0A2H0UBP2_9BACT|nr:MAG: hypothetical protein COU18_02445 [Candidatus Kaiserbacteria bacterium CG10_big_fil_rev_8_21_14_0_10_51_14]